MTREELIARIEAGETGPELLCAIARIEKWNFDFGGEAILGQAMATKAFTNASLFLSMPDWLTSLDAAVSLLGDMAWAINSDGTAYVGIAPNMKTATSNNPAAALVAAWLKATA